MRVNGYSIVTKMLDRALYRAGLCVRRATRFVNRGAIAIIAASALTIAAVTISGCKTTPAAAIAGAPDSTQDASRVTVGDDRLQAIADFRALLAILHGKKNQQPLIGPLLADAPLPVQAIRDVFDGFSVERVH